VRFHRQSLPREYVMKNYVAPLTFTIAAAWVIVLFVLVHAKA
jgi:hypothetical protein